MIDEKFEEEMSSRRRNIREDNFQFLDEALERFKNSDDYKIYLEIKETPQYKQLKSEKMPELSTDFLGRLRKIDDRMKERAGSSKFLISLIEYGYVKEEDGQYSMQSVKTYDFDNIYNVLEIKRNFRDFEGIILPNGKYIPAYGGHHLLCGYCSMLGLDTRTCIRTLDLNGDFQFDDISTSYMDMEKPLIVTNEQAETFYKMAISKSGSADICKILKTSLQYHCKSCFNPNIRKRNLLTFEEVLPDKVDAYDILKEINTSERIERAVAQAYTK